MRVCVIVVTFNRSATLKVTLEAVNNQSVKPTYLVVVDNGSKDNTRQFLESYSDRIIYPIHLQVNMGFGCGLSLGMKYALSHWGDFDCFLLMDDDSHPERDYIQNLTHAKLQFNKPGILSTMGFVDHLWKGPISIYFKTQAQNQPALNEPLIYEVDHVLVDGALVDREVAETIGTFREDVFMMCEDAEYSKRIKRAGYAVAVLFDQHNLNRLHLGGGDRFTFSTRWRGYYHARNHLMIVKEYFSWRLCLMYFIRQTKYLLASLQAPDRFDRIRLRLLGIWHGLIGRMGKTIDPETYRHRS